MKKSKLILLARVFMLTFHLGFAVLSWTYTGPAFSEGVAYAQGGSRALISDPDGLLRGNAKAKDAVGLINWVCQLIQANEVRPEGNDQMRSEAETWSETIPLVE